MSGSGEPDPRDAGPPDPGPETGRRTNGLPARDWTAVADLASGAGEPVLAALADEGVPAYLEPGAEEPEERLWVASEHAGRATTLLTSRFPTSTRPLPTPRPGSPEGARPDAPEAARSDAPEGARPGAALPPGLDEDAAWAAIVAGWDSRGGDAPVAPWPVAEDLPEPPTGTGGGGPGVGGSAPPRPGAMPPPLRRSGEPAPGGRRVVRPAGEGRDGPGAERLGPADRAGAGAAGPPRGPRDHVAPDDPADEHYSPPPPPPLPRLRRATLGSLAAVALGVLLLFAPGVVGLRGGDGLAVVAIALVVGGVVALVLGMRDGHSDPDGGAVV